MSLKIEQERMASQEIAEVALKVEPFDAYVHVAYGYDSVKWQKNWREGKVLGLNEEFPYGYHRAAEYGASVVYSTDHAEGRLQKLLRYGIRGLLGFDFVHAWRNRKDVLRADVIWTHTESQSLAILALLAIITPKTRPRLIGQVVWLIDEWPRLSVFRKALYRWLLKDADILTFHSPLNVDAAKALFPGTRIEFVKFGINTDYPTLPRPDSPGEKIRVLSVGNDRHRDWATLINAAKGADDIEFRLLTTTYKLRGEHDNVAVIRVNSNEELFAQFEWADMLVLPLKPNLHASGITVIEEATILGVPVIATNAGGLDAYFREGEVHYIGPSDQVAMRNAIRRLAANPLLCRSLVANAKRRMKDAAISSRDYAKHHVELSMELLSAVN